jgi:hypothetical protein
MKALRLLICFFITINFLGAQVSSDILRIGIANQYGTARIAGTGGSMSALGADFGCISQNPAGLGAFRKSEFTFTPAFFNAKSTSTLEGDGNVATKDSKFGINLSNLGLIGTTGARPNKKWSNLTFGIGLNRSAEFREKISYEGISMGSIVEKFKAAADGQISSNLDDYAEKLAWQSGAIYDVDDDLNYETDFDTQIEVRDKKSHTIESKGRINDFFIGYGANYKEFLQLGMTIGIPYYSYHETNIYSENDSDEHIRTFNNLSYTRTFSTKGTGINAKFGFILKPIYNIRVGFGYHTPSYYKVTEDYTAEFTYDYTTQASGNQRITSKPSEEGQFKYAMISPQRLIGSIAFVSRIGFLSGEIEYIDYRQSKYKTDSEFSSSGDINYFKQLNNEIDKIYQSIVNVKFGGELAYDIFRIRGGFGLYGRPFANEEGYNPAYSIGLGIREDNFFIDLAYNNRSNSKGILAYQLNGKPKPFATSDITQHQIMLTIGLKISSAD